MNTNEITAEFRMSYWAGIMRERSESGLSIKAYCANAGIHENTYFYWQKKLRESACGQLAELQGTLSAPAGFIEAKMPKTTAKLSLREPARQGELRIEVSGLRISADSGYPADKIAVLLRGIMSC